MKLTVNPRDFQAGLSQAVKCSTTKTTLPILANVLVAATKEGLRLSATDLQRAITVKVPAQVEKEGSTTVNAHALAELVGLMGPSTLKIEDTHANLTLENADGKNRLRVIDALEFPTPVDWIETGEAAEITVADLDKALSKLVFAAAADDARPTLASIFVNQKMAATDGFRLSLVDRGFGNIKALIQAKRLDEVPAIFKGAETVKVYANQGRVLFCSDKIAFLVMTVDGSYPDFNLIVPHEFKGSFEADREEAIRACKQAQILGDSTVLLTITDLAVNFQSESTDTGECNVTIEAAATEPFVIRLNTGFVIDAISSIETARFKFSFNAENKPVQLSPVGSNGYKHILMPIGR